MSSRLGEETTHSVLFGHLRERSLSFRCGLKMGNSVALLDLFTFFACEYIKDGFLLCLLFFRVCHALKNV